jgi:hypothetical protein
MTAMKRGPWIAFGILCVAGMVLATFIDHFSASGTGGTAATAVLGNSLLRHRALGAHLDRQGSQTKTQSARLPNLRLRPARHARPLPRVRNGVAQIRGLNIQIAQLSAGRYNCVDA